MKVLIIGCNGKMGKELTTFLRQNNTDVFGIDAENRNKLPDLDLDVIVDFSCAGALKDNLNLALKLNKPIIVATTGHDTKNLKLIKQTSNELPIFISSNFSFGFYALIESISSFSKLKNYDFTIIETHHKQKKDIPSGSAITLRNQLSNYNIKSQTTSIRTGSVFGEHKLLICGENEIIEIKHTALNRKLFCEGVFKAIGFMKNKKNGLYEMKDLFNDSL